MAIFNINKHNLFIVFLWALVFLSIKVHSLTHSLTHERVAIPESVKSAGQAVWIIENGRSSSRGTGFFISPTLFVTNFHVIVDFMEEEIFNATYVRQKDYLDENFKIIQIKKIVALSAYPDLALLEMSSPAPSFLKLKESPVDFEARLFMVGYPKGLDDYAKKSFILENIESIKNIDDNLVFPVNYFDGLFGVSGSPVIDFKGHVAGVSWRAYDNLLVSAPNYLLKTFLEEGKKSEPCKDKSLQECLDIAIQDIYAKAEEGNGSACFKLATMKIEGIGVGKNNEEALNWMYKALDQGFTLANYGLDWINRNK